MTEMSCAWCTAMSWPPSSQAARTPASECTGTTSGSPNPKPFQVFLPALPFSSAMLCKDCNAWDGDNTSIVCPVAPAPTRAAGCPTNSALAIS